MIHWTHFESKRIYAALLWGLTGLFFLRVAGQAWVAFGEVSFLPAMEAWYSGLIPYSVLLPVQLLILLVQIKIGMDVWRGRGVFSEPEEKTGIVLKWISAVYFGAMALRYVITMALYPERRWFGGTIPIFFHWVLAAYLFVLGHFYQHGPGKRASLS